MAVLSEEARETIRSVQSLWISSSHARIRGHESSRVYVYIRFPSYTLAGLGQPWTLVLLVKKKKKKKREREIVGSEQFRIVSSGSVSKLLRFFFFFSIQYSQKLTHGTDGGQKRRKSITEFFEC